MKFRGNRKITFILSVLCIAVFAAVIAVLVRWTESIRIRNQQKQLKEAVRTLVDTYGERGLLEFAGVKVNEIYYGDDGVVVFTGDSGSWFYSSQELLNMEVFAKCSPAVVHISTSAASDDVSSIMTGKSDGVGSGFFVSPDGYICTNYHVIENASSIRVTTENGTDYTATVRGTDVENDIAVLKISPGENEGFLYLSFASSEDLAVGQRVLAVGNPFGFDRTMVSGMISGLSRPIRDNSGRIMLGMIQTDAVINPGNSGGPLLNTRGEVIGVCAEIYSSTGTSQGMSFAISSDTVEASVSELIRNGFVSRGWLDIIPVPLSRQIVEYASLKVDSGILISQLVPGGKAMAAGLQGGTRQVMYGSSLIYLGGDVITAVNDIEVAGYSDLFNALSSAKPGDYVRLTVNRNGVRHVFRVELVERTAELLGWINL